MVSREVLPDRIDDSQLIDTENKPETDGSAFKQENKRGLNVLDLVTLSAASPHQPRVSVHASDG